MAKGSRYDQQFKENAVRYRLEHPELSLQKGAYQHGDPGIIPVMRRKRSHVSSVN